MLMLHIIFFLFTLNPSFMLVQINIRLIKQIPKKEYGINNEIIELEENRYWLNKFCIWLFRKRSGSSKIPYINYHMIARDNFWINRQKIRCKIQVLLVLLSYLISFSLSWKWPLCLSGTSHFYDIIAELPPIIQSFILIVYSSTEAVLLGIVFLLL